MGVILEELSRGSHLRFYMNGEIPLPLLTSAVAIVLLSLDIVIKLEIRIKAPQKVIAVKDAESFTENGGKTKAAFSW